MILSNSKKTFLSQNFEVRALPLFIIIQKPGVKFPTTADYSDGVKNFYQNSYSLEQFDRLTVNILAEGEESGVRSLQIFIH